MVWDLRQGLWPVLRRFKRADQNGRSSSLISRWSSSLRRLREELEALEAEAVPFEADAQKTAERCGASVLHHDVGIDDRGGRLAGVVRRDDVVMFPVNCVSHDAVVMLKRLCRQSEKPFVPLRSSGVASFPVALGRIKASPPVALTQGHRSVRAHSHGGKSRDRRDVPTR